MNIYEEGSVSTDSQESSAQTLRSVMRFGAVVRRYKYIVLVTLLLSAGVGVLKFLSDQEVPTVYQSTGSVLLKQRSYGVESKSKHDVVAQQKSFASILVSDVILGKAFAKVQPLPPEINQNSPQEDWARQMRSKITVEQDKSRPDLIEISCQSIDPHIPAAILNAVVGSAQEFLDDSEQSMTLELVKSLDKERTELESRLFDKERDLFEAQRQAGEFSISENTEMVHPLVQRALDLNQSCIELQRKRIELKAALAATRKSLQSGGNLSSILKSIEPLLDEGQVATLLNLIPNETLSALQQKLHEKQQELASLRQYYGAAHPKIVNLKEEIRRDAELISQATAKLLAGAQDQFLGGRLLRFLEESLAIASEREAVLLHSYEQAAQAAMAVNRRLAEIAIAKREVSLLRHLHSTILDRLARIDVSDNLAHPQLVMLNEPAAVGTPIPKTTPLKTLALALAIGLALGLAIVYAIDVMDDRFRSPEELSQQLGMPVLAMIRDLPQTASSGAESLQVHVNPQSVESEAFRTLRTLLALADEDRQRLAITSAEPSDGKTTVLANLGVTYAQSGKKTLIIDADLRRPGLTKLFELRQYDGLSTVLRSTEDVRNLCGQFVQSTDVSHLDVIPSGPRPGNPVELLSSPRLSEILAWAESHYDQVLIDCPPILATSEPAIVGRLVDGLLMVIQPTKNRRRLLLRGVHDLNALGVNVLGIVANKVGSEKSDGYYGYGYGYEYSESDDQSDDDADSCEVVSDVPSRNLVPFRPAA